MYVQVTLGRNVAGTPMTESRWLGYIQLVEWTLRSAIDDDDNRMFETRRHFDHPSEESATVAIAATAGQDLNMIRDALILVRGIYDQDDIGLTISGLI